MNQSDIPLFSILCNHIICFLVIAFLESTCKMNRKYNKITQYSISCNITLFILNIYQYKVIHSVPCSFKTTMIKSVIKYSLIPLRAKEGTH